MNNIPHIVDTGASLMNNDKLKQAIEEWGKQQWGDHYVEPMDDDLVLMISLIEFVMDKVKK